MVELADRRLVQVVPRLATVPGHVRPAIGTQHHVTTVSRIDPQGMPVGMHATPKIAAERHATIRGMVLADTQYVDVTLVGRIDLDHAEVHRPRMQAVDPLPVPTSVHRLEDASVLIPILPLLILDVGALASK